MFNDRKKVCNDLERMESKHCLQSDDVFREQSILPLLPAYNTFMGAVDHTSQLKSHTGLTGS